MGFLDKVKSQVEQVAKQGQDKIDDIQAKKQAESLLRDIGAWHYALETGRDDGKGRSEIERLVGELRAHEAEHGPLTPRADEATAPESAAPPPAPMAAPPTSPPPMAPAPMAAPTSPPPPPMAAPPSTPPPAGSVPPPPPGVVPSAPEVREAPAAGASVDDV